MRFVAIAFLLLSTAVPVPASPEHWTEVHSPRFNVLTNSSDKEGRRIADQFERLRAVFDLLLPVAAPDTVPITVVALKDRQSFEALEAKEDLAKGKLAPGGFFIESGQKSYIVLRLDAPSEWQSHAIYHEYTHFMTRNVVLPMWMIEGLAEFYGSTEIGLTSVKLGKPSPEVVFYLTNRRLLPLSTLLKVSRGMPEYNGEKMALTFYGESWALTHLLILKDFQQKTHHLHEYVENLREGQDSLAAANERVR